MRVAFNTFYCPAHSSRDKNANRVYFHSFIACEPAQCTGDTAADPIEPIRTVSRQEPQIRAY